MRGMPTSRRHPTPSWQQQNGHSLIELLWSLGILALLTGAGWPAFHQALQQVRARGVQQQLVADLRLAQREASRRGQSVTMTPRPLTCSADGVTRHNWGCGWLVFVDVNADGVFDTSTDRLIRDTPGVPHVAIDSSRKRVRFSPQGSTTDVQRFDIGSHPLTVTVSWLRLRI